MGRPRKIKEVKVKRKKIEPGETVHCWHSGDNYIAHKHMLFLGPDKKAKDKLLVQSKEFGWQIIRLSDLPIESYRSLGGINIQEEIFKGRAKDRNVIGYTYQFFDKSKPVFITVKIYHGVWRIRNDFEAPSWKEVLETIDESEVQEAEIQL